MPCSGLLPLPLSYVILGPIQPMNLSDCRHRNGAARLVRIMAGAAVLAACAGPATETPLPPPTRAGATATAPSTPTPAAGGPALLAFASDRAGAGDIFVVGADRWPVNLTNDPAGDWDPAWSPACADPAQTCRIAFTSHRSGDSEIWTMDADGRNLRNVTQNPAWDYWPAWSPDGTRIVFVSERDGDQELFVQPADGSGPATQLTFNEESDRLPAWSPDGSRIAFAAVRGGVEEIHVINAECPAAVAACDRNERGVVTRPLKGTAPAWSPDGRRIAFVGWNREDRSGIYIVGPQPDAIRVLWEAPAWIGSLTWAPPAAGQGEGWLLFTSWQDGNHELYAMPANGGRPVCLTRNPAWDDFPSVRPGSIFTPDVADGAEVVLSPPTPAPADADFAYGVNMADLGKAYLVRDIGFGWAKEYTNWETVEPQPGQYRWDDPDNIVDALGGYNLHILMRVHGTPAWARPAGTFLSYPPNDMADFGRFMEALATRYKGKVAAYEIWNEPNLDYEWGYLKPDPARYTALLKAAYLAVKKVDPQALVISAGLATTGEGSATAMGDLAFLQGMYDAGARGSFDALGSHPYAYGHDPDTVDPWGLSMSRVIQQREVMVANGDDATPVWITEAGWVLRSSWNLVEHANSAVDEAQQAQYLVRAYQKTRAEWPWVKALFLFNLDFSSVPWYAAAEPMRWYAIINPDRTPRPAYTSIKDQMTNIK
jgi:Tol biopolymer transport system component